MDSIQNYMRYIICGAGLEACIAASAGKPSYHQVFISQRRGLQVDAFDVHAPAGIRDQLPAANGSELVRIQLEMSAMTHQQYTGGDSLWEGKFMGICMNDLQVFREGFLVYLFNQMFVDFDGVHLFCHTGDSSSQS